MTIIFRYGRPRVALCRCSGSSCHACPRCERNKAELAQQNFSVMSLPKLRTCSTCQSALFRLVLSSGLYYQRSELEYTCFSDRFFLRAEATSKSENPMKRRTTMYLPLVPRGSLFYTTGSPENLRKILLLYDMFIIEMFIRKMWIRKMWILRRVLKRCLKSSLLKS